MTPDGGTRIPQPGPTAEESRCVYCGRPVKRGQTVCGFHSDLPALDDYGGLKTVPSRHRRSQGR